MLRFGGDHPHKLIAGATYSYVGFINDEKNKPNVAIPLKAFSSNHGSPEERFYDMVCIAYGSDDKLFGGCGRKGLSSGVARQGYKYEDQVLAWRRGTKSCPRSIRKWRRRCWLQRGLRNRFHAATRNS